MRLSIIQDEYAIDFNVFCNGELLEYCVEADDEEGWANCIDINTIENDGSYLTKVVTGKIEFKLIGY